MNDDLDPRDGHRPRPGPDYWAGYCLGCGALVDEHVKRPIEDLAAFYVFGGMMVALVVWFTLALVL